MPILIGAAMRRRGFITFLGGAIAWPFAADVQKTSTPVIGYFSSRSAATEAAIRTPFLRGLADAGFVVEQNVLVEYRFADGRNDRLKELAADLVRRQVSILVATDRFAASAAKAATSAIPLVFLTGDDPVRLGLVKSLRQPSGNATGVYVFTSNLGPKRLGLIRDLFEKPGLIAFVVDSNTTSASQQVEEMQAAAKALGQPLLVLRAGTERELDDVFATMAQQKVSAVLHGTSTFFQVISARLIALAAQYKIPACYEWRDPVVVGGLMSYNTDRDEFGQQMGNYTASFPWGALPLLAGELMAVMFVTAISLLLNMTGIEIATRHEADLNRDLNVLGAANLLSAAFGGYVSCVSLLRSTLNYSAGATGRLSGVTMAAIAAAMLLVDPNFLAYIPKCVLTGLLLYLGLDLMYRWLVDSARRLSFVEYASLLAISLIIVNWGFIAGVLIGVVIGCATFALSASRVNVIKFQFDGSEYRSSLDRSPDELALLGAHGRELQGMSLQSYLFFGSANRLYEHVKGLLANYGDCRFLVFDFRLVTGIDSSSTHSCTQIKQAADAAGARLVLVNLTREIKKEFRNARLITGDVNVSDDLDHALEGCENKIIETHRVNNSEAGTLRGWLTEALGGRHHADDLARYFRRINVDAGEVIARQGEPADSMLFIVEGRVGVIVDVGDGRFVRVRSVGRHTTIGEMGLITRQPRSATIEAEVASVLYELSADAYERIKANNSALSHALHTYVIRVMAERVSFASRVIGALQR